MGLFAISRQIGDRLVATFECNGSAMKGPARFLNISIQEGAIQMKASPHWMSIQWNRRGLRPCHDQLHEQDHGA